MAFTPIDEQTWERREYLEVFRQTAIYLTAEVDIPPLYRHTQARGGLRRGGSGFGMSGTLIIRCPAGTPRICSP